ncbi:MAG TPA: hypothetical protein PLN12_14220, partial [Flavobacteriales bacterium]|nr:hypothetical protein [Flavobacteriales bacterium]
TPLGSTHKENDQCCVLIPAGSQKQQTWCGMYVEAIAPGHSYPCGMGRKWLILCSLGLLLLAAPASTSAQDGISRKKQEKLLEKKAKTDKKEKAAQEKADRKRHLSLQDKATRKRIKRNTKRAGRHGTNPHKDNFFQRIFGG